MRPPPPAGICLPAGEICQKNHLPAGKAVVPRRLTKSAATLSGQEVRTQHLHDAQGQVAWVRDSARNTTTQTLYDLAGRPMRKTLLTGSGTGTAHAYTGEVSYNQFELISKFTESVGTARTKFSTAFTYDTENRVTNLAYGTGSLAYTYDGLGRITKRVLKPGSTAVNTTYGYLAGGRGTNSTTALVQTIAQGGITLTYAYDNCDNITSVSNGTKATQYYYDALGQLIRVNDQFDTRAHSTGTTWIFTYDLGGNILSKTSYVYVSGTGTVGAAQTTQTYTYGDTNWRDKLTALNSTAIEHDAIGNLTEDETWNYTWQHGRQLRLLTKKTGSRTVSFVYNEDGLRTLKTDNVNGVNTVTAYTLHGTNIVHLTRGSDTLHFYYDAQNKPAIVIFNGTAYGYLYNLQGDVVALVNTGGTKVVEYTYDAWGTPLTKTGTLASTLGTVQPFRYRGYVWDEETQLYYLRSRYYRPAWGRFINADSIVKGNLFAYCGNEPVGHSDRTGTSYTSELFQCRFGLNDGGCAHGRPVYMGGGNCINKGADAVNAFCEKVVAQAEALIETIVSNVIEFRSESASRDTSNFLLFKISTTHVSGKSKHSQRYGSFFVLGSRNDFETGESIPYYGISNYSFSSAFGGATISMKNGLSVSVEAGYDDLSFSLGFSETKDGLTSTVACTYYNQSYYSSTEYSLSIDPLPLALGFCVLLGVNSAIEPIPVPAY